jgi:hypothetical protein
MPPECTSEILASILAGVRHRFLLDTRRMPNGCLEWVGRRTAPRKHVRVWGYGTLTIGGRTWSAHRAAWDLFRGAIPDGMLVLHTCDNPPCVDWENHLYLGTNADNMRDQLARGRHNPPVGATHPRAVLSEADVAAIRASVPAFTQTELATQFGVHQATISKIVRNRARTRKPV